MEITESKNQTLYALFLVLSSVNLEREFHISFEELQQIMREKELEYLSELPSEQLNELLPENPAFAKRERRYIAILEAAISGEETADTARAFQLMKLFKGMLLGEAQDRTVEKFHEIMALLYELDVFDDIPED